MNPTRYWRRELVMTVDGIERRAYQLGKKDATRSITKSEINRNQSCLITLSERNQNLRNGPGRFMAEADVWPMSLLAFIKLVEQK